MCEGVFVAVCVFPAVARAGATGTLDSVCVIETLYKVILDAFRQV